MHKYKQTNNKSPPHTAEIYQEEKPGAEVTTTKLRALEEQRNWLRRLQKVENSALSGGCRGRMMEK